jgi:hypothetical protein
MRRPAIGLRHQAAGSQAILDTSLFIGSRNFTGTSGGVCRPDRDFPLLVRW